MMLCDAKQKTIKNAGNITYKNYIKFDCNSAGLIQANKSNALLLVMPLTNKNARSISLRAFLFVTETSGDTHCRSIICADLPCNGLAAHLILRSANYFIG